MSLRCRRGRRDGRERWWQAVVAGWRRGGLAGAGTLLMLAAAACVVAHDPAEGPAPLAASPPRIEPAQAVRVADRHQQPRPGPLLPDGPRRRCVPPLSPPSRAVEQLMWVAGTLHAGPGDDLHSHLSPRLLADTSAREFRRLVQRWRRDYTGFGPVEMADVNVAGPDQAHGTIYAPHTRRYLTLAVELDEAGLIARLVFSPLGRPPGEVRSWSDVDSAIARLPWSCAVAAVEVAEGGQGTTVHEGGVSGPMPIAGVSRLFIAGAVADAVADGRLRWDQTVVLREECKSLGPGFWQQVPEGTEVRVGDLVRAMLTAGDNAAADHLLHHIGRERVEAYAARFVADPAPMRPFLTTMELYRLRLGVDAATARRYADADAGERLAMLGPDGPVARAHLPPGALLRWARPWLTGRIGWFATAGECCRVMIDLMSRAASPGMEALHESLAPRAAAGVDTRVWTGMVDQRGGEPGVLCVVRVLHRRDGRIFVLCVQGHDPRGPIDASAFTAILHRAQDLLALPHAPAP